MSEVDNNLSLQDLRAIIHGLKMSGFAFIEDEDTRYNVTCMISDLPSPECLLSMCQKPDELKRVREYVGEIMKIVDCGGNKDESFKTRFEAKKDMPPRYNVLKWRKNMNKEVVAKNLIEASIYADNHAEPLIAENAIKLAKKITAGTIVASEINDFSDSIAKSKLFQEAAMSDWWAGLKGGMGGLGQEVKNVGHGFIDPMKVGAGLARSRKIMENITKNVAELQKSLSESQQWIQDPAFKKDLTGIINIVSPFVSNSQGILEKLNSMEVNYKRTKIPVGGDQTGGAGGAGGQSVTEGQSPAGAPASLQNQMQQRMEGGDTGGSLGDALKAVVPDPNQDMFDPRVNPPANSGSGMSSQEKAYTGDTSQFEAPTPEATPSAAPSAAPSGKTAPKGSKIDQMNKSDIFQLLTQGTEKETRNNIIDNNFAEWGFPGKTYNELTEDEARQIAKKLGVDKFALSNKFNKTSSSKKWIRVI